MGHAGLQTPEPRAPQVAVGAVVLVTGPGGAESVVLVQRGRPPAVGSWTLPGGRVQGGERLVDAVRREIHEETGLDVEVLGLVEVIEILAESHHYVVLDYACRARGTAGEIAAALIAGDDAQDVRLVPLDELDRYEPTDAVRRVIERARSGARAEPGVEPAP